MKSSPLYKTVLLIIALSSLFRVNSYAQSDFENILITGPSVTVVSKLVSFTTYAIDADGNTIPYPTTGDYQISWSVYTAGNQLVSQGPGGFSTSISFAQPGAYYVFCDLVWSDGTRTVYSSPNFPVTVNSLTPPNPSSTFGITKNCSNTVIARSSPPSGANYAYYWQTMADGTRTDLAQPSITFTTVGPLYLRARSTDAPYNWSTQSQFVGNIDIVTTSPTAPPSAIDGVTIGNGFAHMIVGQVSNATEYKWYTQQTGGQTVSLSKMTNEYYRSITSPMSFWVSALIGACESSTRTKVSATICPVPILSASNDGILADSRPVVITVANGTYDSYTWVGPTGADIPSATTASYSAIQTGTYKLRVTKGNSTAYTTPDGILVSTGFIGLNENYIRTDIFQRPGIMSSTNIDALSVSENQKTLAYFDGLGKPVQNVAYQASPMKNDLVSAIEYDPIGRETKKYLTYADIDSHNGWFKKNAILGPNPIDGVTLDYASSDQYKFYNNTNADRVAQDQQPYSETILEASPSSRPLKIYGEGQNWGVQEANRFIENNYLSNIHGTSAGQEKIIAWILDNGGEPVRSALVNGYTEPGGYYSSNQLFIKQTVDEQGHAVREYMDKTEKLILKKIQITSGTANLNDANAWALTYYIYDNAGNLSYVFQPELSKIVHADDSYVPSTVDLNAFAFQYHYDYRNRMSERKVPGQDWVYMIYNNRDELILTQDGKQRAGSPQYWTFTKYDGLGRAVLTGIKDTTVALSQAAMQQAVNGFYAKSWSRVYEIYVGNSPGNIHGYTNVSYPVVTTSTSLDASRFIAVSYYDNYDFKTLWRGNYEYQNDALQENANNYTYNQPATESLAVIGEKTGTKVKVLDGGVSGGYSWLKSVNYYDEKYRIIQVKADNYKGGIDRTSNLYDFTGNILKSQTTHIQTDVAQWKDLVGVSVVGNKITRTASGSNWGVSGLASIEALPANTDGWVEFTASEETTARMLGFSETNTDANYTTIGYALYLRSDKTLWVYEGGTSKGQIANGYKTGDIFRIQRTGTKIKYFRNGTDVSPNVAQTASSTPLYIDIALANAAASIIDVRSSFTSGTRTIGKRFVYDHAGRLMHEYHTLDDQPEVELISNEYNELGQLVDKKLHSISGSPYKQSIDYRYNIRGWLTSINDSELTDNENDYFGMNLAYNEEQGTGNSEFTISTTNQVGAYSFTGNTNDGSQKALNGSVVSTASLTTDNQGNANQAYAFDGTGYIEIPNSKTEHAFIQNTGEFTITTFLKLNDLSARSVILSNTATSLYKGFLFMYETYGGTAGDHQLRLTITNGQSGISTINLGGKNTINDNNWHHVAVVGDGSYIRFYVDGVLDGTPSPITVKSTGDANYTTFIGKSRTTNGAAILGMNGSLDELYIFDRALNMKEIQALANRAQAGVKQTSGSKFNGNISGIKWSINQGLSDIKEMAYTFDYDPMNRLSQANHLQTGASHLWESGKFHEGELQYDLNGNIKNLVRYGDTGMQDNLTYNYGAVGATGNQLLKVTDASDKFTGFIDGTNTANDYSYDANGNMQTDLNKGISPAITYNYLNLPELVTRGVGTVRYIYDANGRKLAQVVTSGSQTRRTDYVGEFQYEEDALQFVNHEEGRIVVSNPELIYSFDASSVDPVTTVDATVATLAANGDQTYVMARATTANSRSGMFPVGGTFPVQPGERYKIRARGYRDKGSVATSNAAYILAQANGSDIAWPGAALQSSSATEAWIEQIVTIPPGATELKAGVVWGTVAAGNTIYLNDFEITRLNDTPPEYQYFIKDHLGNIRVTFTTKEELDTATATLEEENVASEQGKFIYYDEAIRVYSNIFDHTNNGESLPSGPPWGDPDAPVQDTPGYSTLLRGGENERYGLAKSLSVMPGDIINMEVYAKYPDPDDEYWSDELRTLIEAIAPGGNPSPGTIIDGGAAGSIGNMTFPFAGWLSHAEDEDNAPKAYLNWLVFDRNYRQLDGGYVKVSTLAVQSSVNSLHELLTHSLVVKEPGYVYIYLSNESETPVDVFFDDFKVEQIKSPVIQTKDYYPFGLTYNSYQRENTLNQKHLFGGKEEQDELGLQWMDHGARMYMPDLGRWTAVDPHADKYEITSPYNYAFNNPLLFNDPTGMDNIIYLIWGGGTNGMTLGDIANAANTFLHKNLGLDNIKVVVYDSKKNGQFDPNELQESDSWAVIGSDRKAVARIATAIDKRDNRTNRDRNLDKDPSTIYGSEINTWLNYGYGHLNPEISDGDNYDGTSGTGIVVDTEDIADGWKTNKEGKRDNKSITNWAAFNTIHGAGHNALGAIHEDQGVMRIGTGVAYDYAGKGKGFGYILSQDRNQAYINAMRNRFCSPKAIDRYGKK